MWSLADALLLSIIAWMLGVLCISCFLIDDRGPLDWTMYCFRNNIPGQPMMRDLAGVCMAMLHLTAIEFLGLHHGIIIWHSAAISTILLPSFVSCIVEKLALPSPAASTTAERTTERTGRARPVAAFGLRYGLLAATCGLAPSANAVVAMRLLRRAGWASPELTGEDSECFVAHFGSVPTIAVAGIATSFEYAAAGVDAVSWRAVLLDWAFASATLAYANGLVYLLEKAGGVLGERNFQMGNRIIAQSQQQQAHGGAGLPFIRPSAIGCAVFGVCSFLMLFIASG
jgi:hypothetical protein